MLINTDAHGTLVFVPEGSHSRNVPNKQVFFAKTPCGQKFIISYKAGILTIYEDVSKEKALRFFTFDSRIPSSVYLLSLFGDNNEYFRKNGTGLVFSDGFIERTSVFSPFSPYITTSVSKLKPGHLTKEQVKYILQNKMFGVINLLRNGTTIVQNEINFCFDLWRNDTGDLYAHATQNILKLEVFNSIYELTLGDSRIRSAYAVFTDKNNRTQFGDFHDLIMAGLSRNIFVGSSIQLHWYNGAILNGRALEARLGFGDLMAWCQGIDPPNIETIRRDMPPGRYDGFSGLIVV